MDAGGCHKPVKGDLSKVKHVPGISAAAKKTLLHSRDVKDQREFVREPSKLFVLCRRSRVLDFKLQILTEPGSVSSYNVPQMVASRWWPPPTRPTVQWRLAKEQVLDLNARDVPFARDLPQALIAAAEHSRLQNKIRAAALEESSSFSMKKGVAPFLGCGRRR